MIHLALWLISAVVVVYFILASFGLGVVILSDGRWKYILGGLALMVVVIIVQTNKQNEASAARSAQNLPLQQQCISNAKANAIRLRQDSVNRGAYTAAYDSQLANALLRTINECKTKYPAY